MGIKEEISEMIAKELGVEDHEVLPEANLQDDLGADSLMLLNLAEAIGEKYGVELGPDDLMEAADVAEVIALVEAGR